MIDFRNRSLVNTENLSKGVDKIHNYPDEYAHLIFRSWEPFTQKSVFICDTPEMIKSKPFLAQLQIDRGRLVGLTQSARTELILLKKMDSLLTKSNY